MAKTIALLNQKGGCGKTTLATNLALALHHNGLRVLLVDADPQGSTRDWKTAGNSPIPVIGMDRPSLMKDLPQIANGYDRIIIDGAPQIQEMAIAVVKAVDAILVPVQPSPYDIWAVENLIEIIKNRQAIMEGKPQATFVISRAIKNTKLGSEIATLLKDYGLDCFQNGTTQRVSYASSAIEGVSVLESQDKTACTEIQNLAKELEDWISHG